MLRRTSAQRASRSPGRLSLTQLRDGLAIVALVLGGVWAGIEFFWDKLIAPRLESALVQVSSTSTLVGRTDCCVLVEVEATLHNTGRRAVYIHASHIAAGAKKLQTVARLDVQKVADLNDNFLERHMNRPPASGTLALDPLYGSIGPGGEEFLLLSVGNLVTPSAKIVPGESIVRHFALLVPVEFPFVSVRALAFVAHEPQASKGITWNWTLAPRTLGLLVVPWRTSEMAHFHELQACAMAAVDQHAKACRSEAEATGTALWDDYFRKDRHAYRQPHAMDFVAWKTKDPAAGK